MRKTFGIDMVAPGALAVACVLALILWMAGETRGDFEPRVPGMDQGSAGELRPEPVEIRGTLARGPGTAAQIDGSWSGFRGDRRDGVAAVTASLSKSWSESRPRTLWSIEVGEGYAGPAVRAGSVYLIDYDHQAKTDAIRALSLADGKEIWRYSYPVKVKRYHGMTRTVPALGGGAIVTIGPKCHVTCLDLESGELRWMLDLVQDFGTKVPQWYAGQCPLIDGDRVILAPGGKSLLMAVRLEDGEIVWETPNPRRWKMTHSSIATISVDGTRMYVYPASKGVVGVRADDGRLLWETEEWKISIATVPTPVPVGDGRVFLSGGYNAGSMMLQVGRQGEEGFAVETVYRLNARVFGATQQTPILHEGHLYGVRPPEGQLVCLRLDGEVVWESDPSETFGLGPFLIAGDLLYALDDEGRLTVAEASPAGFRRLGEFQAIPEGHEAWGPMALVGRRLLARDLTRLVCLDVGED